MSHTCDHHDHGGHGHDHSAEHFKSCTNPETCYCEVKRFALAFLCITVAIGFQLWFLAVFTSSYGAEGDVSHSFADDLYYLALIPLVLFKRSHKKSAARVDLIGFCLNTALLLLAAAFIIFRLTFGHRTMELEPWAMAVVGLIGLVGNIGQFVALGTINWKGTSNLQGAAQHVAFDMANSVAVIFDAFVNYVVGGTVGLIFDQAVAFLIAMSMFWTCWKNWERILEKLYVLSKN
jgi:Co/Zn/Cd efflux system component